MIDMLKNIIFLNIKLLDIFNTIIEELFMETEIIELVDPNCNLCLY